MIEPIKVNYPIFNRYSNFDTEELTSLELAGRTTQKVNEIIGVVNGVDARIAGKEDSLNITNNRKLSQNGNFTGYLMGKAVSNVLYQVDSNDDNLKYLVDQFAHGQTGLIIDGGFFPDSGIDKNYDGGVF